MKYPQYLLTSSLVALALANTPAPVMLETGDWLGDDGNWSTVQLLLGSPPQTVNVLASNTLSEIWAVGAGGCYPQDPLCSQKRGGLYQPRNSKHWYSMGSWQLGQKWLGHGGNGDYGLDTLKFYSSISKVTLSMSNVLTAAVNTTTYFDGYFGLGINAGTFGNQIAQSPLTQAVQTFGWLPSYSYGYTAGAHYRNIPTSVTLGGYDASKLIEHDTTFTLDPDNNLPRALIRGIQAEGQTQKPHSESWNLTTQSLSTWDDRFTVLLDSTTPYLWMPEHVCDAFATNLNLTYNDTLDLYTLTDTQYNAFTNPESLAFTFSISSFDNLDNFGAPLDTNGVLNITIPIRALVSTVQFPFGDEAVEYGQPAIPYFSLRRAISNSSLIIGRSFFQEAYLRVKYDEGVYSLHQANFSSPVPHVVQIDQSPQSHYSPPPTHSTGHSLSVAEKVGIAVAVVIGVAIASISCICYRRRQSSRVRRVNEAGSSWIEEKDTSTIASQEPPRTLRRILTKLSRTRTSQRSTPRDPSKGASSEKGPLTFTAQTAEVPDSEIYELPAPLPPVELNGDDTDYDAVESSISSEECGSYEAARRRIERQLQGPAPAYSPPTNGFLVPLEKGTVPAQEPIQFVEIQDRPRQPSVVSSDASPGADGTASPPHTLPSPVSVRGASMNRWAGGALAPTIIAPKSPDKHQTTRLSSGPDRPLQTPAWAVAGESTMGSHLGSEPSCCPSSPSSITTPITALSVQRTLIHPSKVVCLGPMPSEFQAREVSSLPRSSEPAAVAPPGMSINIRGPRSHSSLGSNFTEEEAHETVQDEPEYTKMHTQMHSERWSRRVNRRSGTFGSQQRCTSIDDPPNRSGHVTTARGPQDRIDPMLELVHVPQMAAKRFSWEDQ